MEIKNKLVKIFLPVGLIAIFLIVGVLTASILKKTALPEEKLLTVKDLPKVIIVGSAIFNLELATTIETRTKGLSNRASLPVDRGMLFIFNASGNYGFWMKDMRFPIDIIWIANSKVIGFEESVEPEGARPSRTYFPPVPVTEVLEINAGLVERLGIKVGDVVRLVNEGGEN